MSKLTDEERQEIVQMVYEFKDCGETLAAVTQRAISATEKKIESRILAILDTFDFEPYFRDARANPILAQRIINRELKPELRSKITGMCNRCDIPLDKCLHEKIKISGDAR